MSDQIQLSGDTHENELQVTSKDGKSVLARKSEADGTPELTRELIIAEYNSLTTELNNRYNIRYQMVQFALAALAAILTVSSVGIQSHLDVLMFLYPVLLLILSIIYATNAFEGRRIKNYIQARIESHLPEKKGWYSYKRGAKIQQLDSMGNVGMKTIFIVTAIFALLIGWQIMNQTEMSQMLLKVGIGTTIILTIFLVSESYAYKLACQWNWIEQA